MDKLMVITGDFNSGKTERLMEIYRNQEKGTADGFACIKDFSNETGEFSGYSLKWLSSGITFPLAVLKEKIQKPNSGYFLFSFKGTNCEPGLLCTRRMAKAVHLVLFHAIFSCLSSSVSSAETCSTLSMMPTSR